MKQKTNKSGIQAKEEIRKLVLSQAEQDILLAKIKGEPILVSVPSPWQSYPFMAWIQKSKTAYALVIVAAVMFAGTSAAFAAEGSLPGDALYPIKVGIIEPIRQSLASSPVAKAQVAADLAEERVQEGQSLAAKGKLTAERQAELSRLIAMQTIALNQSLAQVAAADPGKADDLGMSFQANMDAQARELDRISGISNESSTSLSLAIHANASSTPRYSAPDTTSSSGSASSTREARGHGRPVIGAGSDASTSMIIAATSTGHLNGDRGLDLSPLQGLIDSARRSGDSVIQWKKRGGEGPSKMNITVSATTTPIKPTQAPPTMPKVAPQPDNGQHHDQSIPTQGTLQPSSMSRPSSQDKTAVTPTVNHQDQGPAVLPVIPPVSNTANVIKPVEKIFGH